MCTCKVPCSAPDGGVVYRPCGKCLECLKQYQQDWTCRLSEEFKAWSNRSVIFFTLTYADPMLPVMVTYNHPISLHNYQVVLRHKSLRFFDDRMKRLGLDSFYYTRPHGFNTYDFINDRKCLQDSYLDIPEFERPVLEVPSCCYEDINSWIRYCRKYYDRHVASVPFRKKRVSPYLEDLTWKNVHGVESSYPDSAYTPSFKYWLCTEYGPETLRPHIHGVFMGVSEEMFRDVFAPWWREHFGVMYSGRISKRSVEFSVFDESKGGALYISKYCSKGSFDHPLVSSSIHYPSGKEFICHRVVDDSSGEILSPKYINCFNWFGLDIPLCVPPFRLISKGIGIRYPFNANLQRYWDVVCDEFTGFRCCDSHVRRVPLSFISEVDVGALTSLVPDIATDRLPSVSAKFCSRFSIQRIESTKRPNIVSQSDFYVDPSVNESDFVTFQNIFFNKKFIRCYVHEGISKTFETLLPKYYRRFLLSPFSQIAVKSSYERLSNDDFDRKRRSVRLARSEDEHDALLRQIRFDQAVKRRISAKATAERFSRFYSRSFKGDLTYEISSN